MRIFSIPFHRGFVWIMEKLLQNRHRRKKNWRRSCRKKINKQTWKRETIKIYFWCFLTHRANLLQFRITNSLPIIVDQSWPTVILCFEWFFFLSFFLCHRKYTQFFWSDFNFLGFMEGKQQSERIFLTASETQGPKSFFLRRRISRNYQGRSKYLHMKENFLSKN